MIGIFDSGLGGLTAVREFFKYLPEYRLVYFGDTARLPYGTKSPDLIKKWSREITQWLLKKGAGAIVIACHTSSALAADFLKKEFPKIPIFEIVGPGLKKAAKVSKNKKIGIIGTPATIKSGIHKKKLLKLNPSLKIYSRTCPLFVPLVEEGWLTRPETKQIVREYLSPLIGRGIDTLVLACTHYPLLKNTISKIINSSAETSAENRSPRNSAENRSPRNAESGSRHIKIVNPAEDLAKTFKEFLEKNPKIKLQIKKLNFASLPAPQAGRGGRHQFFFSDRPYNFSIISKTCLGKEVNFKIVPLSSLEGGG